MISVYMRIFKNKFPSHVEIGLYYFRTGFAIYGHNAASKQKHNDTTKRLLAFDGYATHN